MAGGHNGNNSQTAEQVDVQALLAEVSARLVTAGSIALPAPTPPLAPPSEQLRIMVFVLEGTRFAVEASRIHEVVRRPQITPVPGLPEWLLGVTNLHGDILSVVDLIRFFNIGESVISSDATMIVAHAADQRIGLLVDNIGLIYSFPLDRLISPPFKIEPGVAAYIRGAVARDQEFIRLLDCERLLLGPQMQQFS